MSKNIIEKKIGTLIKNLIKTNGLSQKSFGKSLKVTQGMVGQWIREDRPISVEIALQIESLYDVDAGIISDDVRKSRLKFTHPSHIHNVAYTFSSQKIEPAVGYVEIQISSDKAGLT